MAAGAIVLSADLDVHGGLRCKPGGTRLGPGTGMEPKEVWSSTGISMIACPHIGSSECWAIVAADHCM